MADASPLYVLSNRPRPEALGLLQADPGGALLLLARGLLTEVSVLEGRDVFCLQEEVRELGLEGKLPAAVKPLSGREVIGLLEQRSVLSIE